MISPQLTIPTPTPRRPTADANGHLSIVSVVGARPNFTKIAPIMRALDDQPHVDNLLVHTGQHYDSQMSGSFFSELGIPPPEINLDVGSGSHAQQTADIMRAFESVLLDIQPDAVLVVGDVNSTVACGLVAVKMGVKLIHVEAGLRSFDRSMPEEINRVLTDSISDLLFCTEQSGVDNLRKEGIGRDKVHLVGNVMIDTLLRFREQAQQSTILDRLDLSARGYAVITLHRPSNVDDPRVIHSILDAFDAIAHEMPMVFPCHPRTRKQLHALGIAGRLDQMTNMRLIDPVGYLDFLRLMDSSRLVLTDSGGIQEETTILNVPCLTLRHNTERPVTAQHGTNRIVGTDTQKILAAYRDVLGQNGSAPATIPPLWDGQAAERIATVIGAKSEELRVESLESRV